MKLQLKPLPTCSPILERRPWSVRATPVERIRALPGDELIEKPIGSFHHAITIRRPRHEVWPWLAQMGAGSRAGWYSYDFLDNGRRPSATRIVPELQQLAVGMIFPAAPRVTDGFALLTFEPERFLVLGWTAPDGGHVMTWAFVLEDAEHGSTRLLVRVRVRPGARIVGLPWSVTNYFCERDPLRDAAEAAHRYREARRVRWSRGGPRPRRTAGCGMTPRSRETLVGLARASFEPARQTAG